MGLTGKIVSFQIGKPQLRVFSGARFNTGINKQQVKLAFVAKDEIAGDGIGNKKNHGGPDRVVCFYPYEHYQMWEKQFGKSIPIPAFGENLTVSGMREDQVYIGDIFRIGESLIQITQGRIPCAMISYFNHEPDFLKQVVETSFTGYFARVLEEGIIREDDSIELVRRVQDHVSVFAANEIYFHHKEGLEGLDRLLAIDELAMVWKSKIMRKRAALLET